MVLLRRNKTYRHVNCKDLDMHVVKIVYLDFRYFKLKVAFVDRKNGTIWTQSGTVKLMRQDLYKWREII